MPTVTGINSFADILNDQDPHEKMRSFFEALDTMNQEEFNRTHGVRNKFGNIPLYWLSYGVFENSRSNNAQYRQSHADLWVTGENYFKSAYFEELASCYTGDEGYDKDFFASLCKDALSVLTPLPIMKIGAKSCSDAKRSFNGEWAIPRTSCGQARNGNLQNQPPRTIPVHREEAQKERVRILGTTRDVRASLNAIGEAYRHDNNVNINAFSEITRRIKDECDFYDELRESGISPLHAYARLLPIWIIKTFNRQQAVDVESIFLSDLGLFGDETAIADLCVLVAYGMLNNADGLASGFTEDSLLNYIDEGARLYCDFNDSHYPNTPNFRQLSTGSVREIYEALYPAGSDFDPTYQNLMNFPITIDYATSLSSLILHLVVRSIFGPFALAEHLGTNRANVGKHVLSANTRIEASSGAVAFLAFPAGQNGAESGWQLFFGNSSRRQPKRGAAFIVGTRFSQNGPFFRQRHMVGNNAIDAIVDQLIGDPDYCMSKYRSVTSKFCSDIHLGGFVVGTNKKLILVDLGSTNGTCVWRESAGEAFVMDGRNGVGSQNKMFEGILGNHGILNPTIVSCPFVYAERGDVVFLGDARIEIH